MFTAESWGRSKMRTARIIACIWVARNDHWDGYGWMGIIRQWVVVLLRSEHPINEKKELWIADQKLTHRMLVIQPVLGTFQRISCYVVFWFVELPRQTSSLLLEIYTCHSHNWYYKYVESLVTASHTGLRSQGNLLELFLIPLWCAALFLPRFTA